MSFSVALFDERVATGFFAVTIMGASVVAESAGVSAVKIRAI
jgi:hypothetical protein